MRILTALIVLCIWSWPSPAFSAPEPLQIRPGLMQALQHRATFTRAHRGPFANQLDGNLVESTDYAAGWHAGNHVYFAWHQRGDSIVFASFNPAGKIEIEPQEIGKGRWPRIAADGDRVAVAWISPDGSNFIVRFHDGNQWGSEIQLIGREAAQTFVPGGPLYAATSTGLWRLNGGHFDRVQDTNFSQPAIAVAKNGQPHIASRQNGRILYDGADVDEG